MIESILYYESVPGIALGNLTVGEITYRLLRSADNGFDPVKAYREQFEARHRREREDVVQVVDGRRFTKGDRRSVRRQT